MKTTCRPDIFDQICTASEFGSRLEGSGKENMNRVARKPIFGISDKEWKQRRWSAAHYQIMVSAFVFA